MTIETTGDAMALVAETERLMKRAGGAMHDAPAMGPKMLGRFIDHVERVRDALAAEVPSMEQVVAELRRL